MSEHVVMACGCTSHAKRKTEDGYVPACIVHDCIEVLDDQPDLIGRTAFCAYGKHAEKPSSPELPFFEYHGPGSASARELCECRKHRSLHHPTWTATIRSVRRWFKYERFEEDRKVKSGQPTEEAAKAWAAKEVEIWLNWSKNPETKILEAELTSLVKGPPSINHPFKARGALPHDKYYCGCYGWD